VGMLPFAAAVLLAAAARAVGGTAATPPRSPPPDVAVEPAVPTSPTERAVRAQQVLSDVVGDLAEYHNTSISIAVATTKLGGVVSVAAGLNNRATGDNLTADHRIPMGSVTKSFTACQVMQAHERGLIDIDAPIHRYVDPVLQRLNGTTMLRLWGGDTTILTVTAKHLMGMRSGLQDYNDSAYATWTWAHPDGDWTPFDILHALDKRFVCPPGMCGVYSSVGFELLGLALVDVTNVTYWWDLDQFAAIPPALRGRYKGVAFPERGKCSLDPQISHQYRMVASAPGVVGDAVSVAFSDIVNYSCLNGWACGNIAITPHDVAQWYYDLFHGNVVSNASLTTMLQGHPLTSGWDPGLRYGLGLSWYHLTGDPANLTVGVGHGGSDYGSLGHLACYNTRFDFGISIATTSVSGMNCSREYREEYPVVPGSVYNQRYYEDDVTCRVYDAVLQVVTDGTAERLNCTGKRSDSDQRPAAADAVTPPPPPSAECAQELEKACGAVRSDPTVCRHCTLGATLPDCSTRQAEAYCPVPPPAPRATPNFTCAFDW